MFTNYNFLIICIIHFKPTFGGQIHILELEKFDIPALNR